VRLLAGGGPSLLALLRPASSPTVIEVELVAGTGGQSGMMTDDVLRAANVWRWRG
jgi:hypothetical protein